MIGKRSLLFFVSTILGVLSVIALVRLCGVNVNLLIVQVRSVRVLSFGRLLLLNLFLILLSTEKWRRVDAVLRHSVDATPSMPVAFAITSAGMALGLLLPVQLGMATARTLGVYIYGRPFKRGAAGTVFEQGFDLLIVCLLAVASIVTWFFHGGPVVWALCAMIAFLAGILGTNAGLRVMRWLAAKIPKKLGTGNRIGSAIEQMVALEDAGILSCRLARELIILSAIRFCVVVLMASETAKAVGAHVAAWQMGAAVPFVVVANLLAITPGGIGINEATATAALKFFGISTVVAAQWSLANRILIMASAFSIAVCAILFLTVRKIILSRSGLEAKRC